MISPNRALSPKSSAALFPASSIIAVDPHTGRPILPAIPQLPNHLILDDDDAGGGEDGEDQDQEEAEEAEAEYDSNDDEQQRQQHGQGRYAQGNGVHPYNIADHDPFAPLSQQPQHSQQPSQQRHSEQNQSQHQRMSSQQETQAYGNPLLEEQDSELAAKRQYDAHIEELMQRYRSREFEKKRPKATPKTPNKGRIENGAETADEEKEELMAHLMGCLRREVIRAEEEAWIFGEVGREEGFGMGDEVDGVAGGVSSMAVGGVGMGVEDGGAAGVGEGYGD